MGKIVDRFLLFLYSLAAGIAAALLFAAGFHWIHYADVTQIADELYHDQNGRIVLIIVCAVVMLISLRFLYISLRRSSVNVPSIDQRTDFGDIRISLETVENLSLKAASRVKGIRDIRARVNVSDAGLEIAIRAVVDGESSIPSLTEETQRQVKDRVEETTGIPVAHVSVFVANIIQSQTFKSRVE